MLDLAAWVVGQSTTLFDWGAAVALGLLVAISDLISRYRDAPDKALTKPAARLYLIVNGAATVGALLIIRAFGWTFGIQGADATRVAQVLMSNVRRRNTGNAPPANVAKLRCIFNAHVLPIELSTP